MDYNFIEVNKLVKSRQNARRAASRGAAEDLKSSILAHGLMQNLVVTAGAGGQYRVIAGSRRLAAIRELQEEGRLPPDYAAPCQIAADGQALEMSLAENTVRLAMHPADEFEAFAKLIGAGSSVEQVAERFGVSGKHVEQRLKLGKVAPKIVQAYRAEKLTLDCLMAFTVTDDRRKQLEAFEAMEKWHGARQIRAMLTGGMADANGKLARFVGLDAYHQAGGVSRADLFGDQLYLESPGLLHRLAVEKLEVFRRQLEPEGWKWVEISPDIDWQAIERLGKLRPIDGETAFDPELAQHAGCVVSIDSDGELRILKGLVRREDLKRVLPAEADARKARSGMPATLVRDLAAARQQVAQAVLAGNPPIAFDLLIFTTASRILGSDFPSGLEVCFTTQRPAISGSTPAGDTLQSIRHGLPLAWLDEPSEADRFDAFRRMSEADKLALLAFCTATCLKPQLGGEEATAYELALSLSAGDVAGHWRPTRANYLARVTRDQLLALGRELLGEQWSQARGGDRKAVLADELGRVFAEPGKVARNADQLARLKSWLPAGMGFAAIKLKKPGKAGMRKR